MNNKLSRDVNTAELLERRRIRGGMSSEGGLRLKVGGHTVSNWWEQEANYQAASHPPSFIALNLVKTTTLDVDKNRLYFVT